MGPSATFFGYSLMCILSFVFCYYKVPETKGVTLEQIELNIRNRLPLRDIGQPVVIDQPIIIDEPDYQVENA